MQIDWWTLGLQTVNALVLIWLLSRFLFRPIASILADRKAAAQRLLDEAAAAEASARTLEEKARVAVEDIASKRAETIRAAVEEAKAASRELLDAAQSDADRMRADMRLEIERLEKSERRAEAERASLLSVDIARRLLDRLPQESRVARRAARCGEARGSGGESARPREGSRDRARGVRVMTERSSDIKAHIVATRQLESVVTAMRRVAAVRTSEAQSRLDGVRAYAEALGEAIGKALALMAETPHLRSAANHRAACGHIILAFFSGRGFVGAFNERILAAAMRLAAAAGKERANVFIVGERGATLARERGLQVDWTLPMASRVDDAPSLAERIADVLYRRLGERRAARVTLIHGMPSNAGVEIIERSLIPLDLARFPPAPRLVPPLVTIGPAGRLGRGRVA